MKYAVAALLSVLMFAAVQLQSAPSPTMTQVELIQWLVQLSGDTGTLPPTPTPTDYVNWAVAQGLNPTGGWQPATVLSRDALAQVLVQFFGYTVKPGSDAFRQLQREGIDLGKDTYITRGAWASVVTADGLAPRSWSNGHKKHSKFKTPSHRVSPPRNVPHGGPAGGHQNNGKPQNVGKPNP